MQLNQYFRSLFLIVAAALSLSVFIGCTSQKEISKPLRIGMNTWPGYEPFVLAKKHGFLAENVKISRVNSATDVIKAFKSDLIDIACLTLDEAIILQSKSDDNIKIIVVMDMSTGGDAVIARKDIGSMQDLKGGRIGVESSALGSFILSRAVDLTPGLSLNDLKVVNLSYEHHMTEFNKGNIDAVVTFEPVKTKLLKGYAHVLFDSSQIPGEILDVMIIKEKTIHTKKLAMQKVVKAWFKSVEYISKERKKSLNEMASYEGITFEEFKIAYTGISVPSLQANRDFFSTQLHTSIKRLNKILGEKKLVSKEIVPQDLYSDVFLKRVE